MKMIDTPLPWMNRTGRELILIGGGLAICLVELARPQISPWNLGVFGVGTALFAARFFAARVVVIGVLLSAVASCFSGLRYGAGWTPSGLYWGAYPMLVGVLLLISRDLEQRFDFAASGPGWRLNRWRELPRAHWRASTVLGWLLGILGHFLLRGWQSAGAAGPTWPLIAIVVCIGAVLLLFTGRSIVFVISAALGIAVAALVLPQVGGAEALMHHPYGGVETAPLWRGMPDSALPAAIAAVGTALVSLPYALLHLWHGLRGGDGDE
jgi:hypothetical protein